MEEAARGETVEEVETGVDGMLLGIGFADEQVGVAVGGTGEHDASLMARTMDGGRSWVPVDCEAVGRLYAVDFATTEMGCAVGYGVVLHTRDGGASWSAATCPGGVLPWLGGVAFADARRGFAVGGGDAPVLWRSDDGGATWRDAGGSLPDGARDRGLRAVAFFDAQNGVAVGSGGLLLHTADGGETWQLRAGGTDESWLKGLGLIDARRGVAVGSHGVVLGSVDAGASWQQVEFDSGVKLNTVGVLDGDGVYVGSMEGRLYRAGADEARLGERASWRVVLDRPGRAIIGSALRPDSAGAPELWFSCDAGTLLRIRPQETTR